MPSKAQMKEEINELRTNLKDATKKLSKVESNPKPVDKSRKEAIAQYRKLESELESTASKMRTETLVNKLSELEMKHKLSYEEIHGKWKSGIPELDKAIKLSQERKAIDAEPKTEIEGNPIACAPAILSIESDIAAGKSYWDLTGEQYNRWVDGEDTCLPCEKDYVEIKSLLSSVGNQYMNLAHPEDIKIESIAATTREQSIRELFRAESRARAFAISCNIKLTRIRSRISAMKPLAHVGRWDEFMNNQKQLLVDFENDIQEVIPNLRIQEPSYAIPVPVKEITEISPKLTVYEREQLIKTLTPEEQKILEETKKLAKLGQRITGVK